jgi:aspartate racemase
LIDSIDMTKMLDLIASDEVAAVTDYLLEEMRRLAQAGADFGVLASNTPHLVFEELNRRSPIPLISIVETACDAVKTLGLQRVGLFGTRFTMQGRFYAEVFDHENVALVPPSPDEQTYIHDKYMGELIYGVLLDETRERLLAIAARMHVEDGIEGLILGGTELPLILDDEKRSGMPFLDTTRLHVERIVARLL